MFVYQYSGMTHNVILNFCLSLPTIIKIIFIPCAGLYWISQKLFLCVVICCFDSYIHMISQMYHLQNCLSILNNTCAIAAMYAYVHTCS